MHGASRTSKKISEIKRRRELLPPQQHRAASFTTAASTPHNVGNVILTRRGDSAALTRANDLENGGADNDKENEADDDGTHAEAIVLFVSGVAHGATTIDVLVELL